MIVSRPHHASPWVVDTRTLRRRAGTLKPLALTVELDAPVGSEVIAVPAGSPVALDLRLESVTEGVLVSGQASATAVGECSRCLAALELPLAVSLRELYVYPGSTTDATTDPDELPRLIDDLLDLEPLVRDELMLALPLVPLCRPDCAGLCPECGVRLDDEPDGQGQGHSHEILDPRWAALAEKFGATGAADQA